jgi:hypothetical protein
LSEPIAFSRPVLELLDLCLINDNGAWEELLGKTKGYVQSVFVNCVGKNRVKDFTMAFPGWLYQTGRLATLRSELKRKQGRGELASEAENRAFFRHYFARIIITGGISDFFSYSSPSTRRELERRAGEWAEKHLEVIREDLDSYLTSIDPQAGTHKQYALTPKGSVERRFGGAQTIRLITGPVPECEKIDDELESSPQARSGSNDENYIESYKALLRILPWQQRVVYWLFEAYHDLGPLDSEDRDNIAGLNESDSETVLRMIEEEYRTVRMHNPDPAHPLPGKFVTKLLKISSANLYKINERARKSLQVLIRDQGMEPV